MLLHPLRSFALLLLLAALALGACQKEESTDVPDCSSGTTSSNIASDVPSWIATNFTCIKASMSGSNVVIETRDLPPYASYYYGVGHTLYDATAPSRPNPNKIIEQSIAMTVPATPTIATSSAASGLGLVGITVNGLAIFNNSAAPGDYLADETYTFDTSEGHPQNSGTYHYHTEPPKLSVDDANLIGIAKDGFPIYGRQDADGTRPFASGDNWHEHATPEFPNGVPHYHVVFDNFQSTAAGDQLEVAYMIGANLGGSAGTVSGASLGPNIGILATLSYCNAPAFAVRK